LAPDSRAGAACAARVRSSAAGRVPAFRYLAACTTRPGSGSAQGRFHIGHAVHL